MERLLKQLSVFTVVGGISTAAHYIVLIVLVQIIAVGAVAASMCGYGVGAVINYSLNYSITFASKRAHQEALWRFLIIAGCGFILNGLIMDTGVNRFAIHYLISQVTATLLVLLWNFMANKFWTFAR